MYEFHSTFNVNLAAYKEYDIARNRCFRRMVFTFGRSIPLPCLENNGTRIARGVQPIQVKDIIGSVGRNTNFDDQFNPRRGASSDRWVSICIGMMQHKYIPPIDVIKVGDVYYVYDGNHRVSVARSLGQIDIDANVYEVI